MLDLDDVPNLLPWYAANVSDADTAESAVEELIVDLLPPEFHRVSCWFRFSNSHGVKPGVRLRLLYLLDRPLATDDLKRWLGHLRGRGVDTSVFSPAQPVLIAVPILMHGAPDPVLARDGIVTGRRPVVTTPSVSALSALATRPRAARGSSGDARHIHPASASTTQAVLRGGGFQRSVSRIGDGPGQDGLHQAIVSAVGSGVRELGPDVDPEIIIRHIKEQIEACYIDPVMHPSAYIDGQLEALPRLVGDVRSMERERLRSETARHALRTRMPVAPDHRLNTTNISEAVAKVAAALNGFMSAVPGWRRRRDAAWTLSFGNDFGRTYPSARAQAPWRERGALFVDVGIGKTEATIGEIVALLASEPDLRVGFVVPMHKLADDVLDRINRAAGSVVAAVWRGLTQPDPADPTSNMCRRSRDAEAVLRAGGSLTWLCGSAARGYCRFHPNNGGPCAYARQRQRKASVWLVPAAMLTTAVPEALHRESVTFEVGEGRHTFTPPSFDLLVLDEAPFLNWLEGFDKDRIVIDLSWLRPDLCSTVYGSGRPESTEVIHRAVAGLQPMLHALSADRATLESYYEKEGGRDHTDLDPEYNRAADGLWDAIARPEVNPYDTGEEFVARLDPHVELVRRVRAIQQLLRVHEQIIDGRASPSCVQLGSTEAGNSAVLLRWREDIHVSWLDSPVLYLDGTARIQLAEQWLGTIKPLVHARAATPNMRVVQVDDRAFGYANLIDANDQISASSAAGHQRRISELMAVARAATGGSGVLLGPKALIAQMTVRNIVPAAWFTASFGSLRGVDSFKDVSVAVVVSRPLPGPRSIELMTEIIFAKRVERIPGDWYPEVPIGRLMADGTGRHANVERHPDANAETVRWTVCEAEVLQAVGRVRGVRRDPTNPVLVIVLGKVDLGEVPVAELTTWDELSARCGPMMQMAATGCIPVMWRDVAHMVRRWNGSCDPAATARAWFRDNPSEEALRKRLATSGLVKNGLTGVEMTFRRECLGMVGKNWRYVWLAGGVTIDNARTMLP